MDSRKIFRNAGLALGLLAAGSVYAAETGVAETSQAKVQEQHTGKQQQMNRYRNEATKQEGQGEQHRHRERNGESGTVAGASSLPGEQGIASVNRNLESNPDNKGLQTASEQLNQNQVRHAEQTAKQSGKREQRMTGKAERHEKAGRPSRAERRGL